MEWRAKLYFVHYLILFLRWEGSGLSIETTPLAELLDKCLTSIMTQQQRTTSSLQISLFLPRFSFEFVCLYFCICWVAILMQWNLCDLYLLNCICVFVIVGLYWCTCVCMCDFCVCIFSCIYVFVRGQMFDLNYDTCHDVIIANKRRNATFQINDQTSTHLDVVVCFPYFFFFQYLFWKSL